MADNVRKALVVEDSESWCEILSETLEFEGYELVVATNRNDALAELLLSETASSHFNLILVDLELPERQNSSAESTEHGLAVIRCVKQLRSHPPVLVATAKNLDSSVYKTLESLGILPSRVASKADRKDTMRTLKNLILLVMEDQNKIRTNGLQYVRPELDAQQQSEVRSLINMLKGYQITLETYRQDYVNPIVEPNRKAFLNQAIPDLEQRIEETRDRLNKFMDQSNQH